MSALAQSRLPIIHVKLPCKDESEFSTRIASTIGSKGVLVSASTLLGLGSHVIAKLEYSSGKVAASGEAVVVGYIRSRTRMGMTLHLVRLDAGSVQFPLMPLPEIPARSPSSPPPLPKGEVAPPLNDAALFADPSDLLLQLGPRSSTPPGPVAATAPPAAAPGMSVPDSDLMAPAQQGGKVAGAGGIWRTPIVVTASVVVVMALAVVGLYWAPQHKAEAELSARVAKADERMSTGRLAGASGDEALDHLLAAKQLKPKDARVIGRLSALADLFDQLGEIALARGDVAEAATHFQGAVLADPSRKKSASRLKELEERVRSGSVTKPVE